MVRLKLLVAAAVVAATASRSDAATPYSPSCYDSSGCSQVDYVECGSSRWYCPWSVGDWGHEDMITDCQYGIHGCVFDNWCGTAPISTTCWPTSCGTGYTFNNSSKRCYDIDECATTTHNCRVDQTCENRRGAFTCKCPSGYRMNTFEECTDIDECAGLFSPVCPVNTLCINTPGSYEFQCMPGFEMGPDGRTCIDIDACATNMHNCHGNQTCVNRRGGYDCECPVGYRLNSWKDCEDINECVRLFRHVCHVNAVCINTPGSYECQCKPGFEMGPDDRTCIDIDECATNMHNCQGNEMCVNRHGGYDCKCPPGYRSNALKDCEDINECVRLFGQVCRVNAICINTPGSYECQCKPGFEMGPDDRTCIDIDECATNMHNCQGNETCVNRRGGYDCKCPLGYRSNALKDCEDINECTSLSRRVCPGHSECINTPGSYICQCKPGFERGFGTHNCTDVNECQHDSHGCEHKCINLWGSYTCDCLSGFRLAADGRTCDDIDECMIRGGCGHQCNGTCVNEPGSYSCSCPEGYRLDRDIRTCHDIDECEEGNVCQGEDETCLNTSGGYRCCALNCPPGYIKDPNRKAHCKRRMNVNYRVDATACREQPSSVSFCYHTLSPNKRIPESGQLNFLHLRGPRSGYSSIDFHLELVDDGTFSRDHDVKVATRDHFFLERTSSNEVTVSLVQPLQGPQVVQLDLKVTTYHNGVCSRTTLSKIFIFVSGNDFGAPLDVAPRYYDEG